MLIDLGLIIGPEARQRRKVLCNKLNIGHSNGKQLLNKLNAFGYTEKDVKEALGYKEE
ncbi:ribonuclease M5 [Staphylococcus aureus]|nr:ribonuclease M5 [Staphylococcus aureus]